MILVTNIQWDTDEEKVELPTSIAIYDSEELETSIVEGDEDVLTDFLSDTYGWLIYSYCYEIMEDDYHYMEVEPSRDDWDEEE